MTYPYAPPADWPLPDADVREVTTVADIITSFGTNRTAAVALWKHWGGGRSLKAIQTALLLVDHEFSKHRGTRHAPRKRGRGDAAAAVQRAELAYRAAYVANASARLSRALDNEQPLSEALATERRYYALHEAARKNRQASALAVDAAAAIHGQTLGWWTHQDDRTTPDCAAANGANFTAGIRPRIGYPGSVHPKCRCYPGPAHATARRVYDIDPGGH